MRNDKTVPAGLITLLMLTVALQLALCAYGQSVSPLREALHTITAYNTVFNPEKIFVQTDKPSYFKDDTLWFKSYVLDASTLAATSKSGIMYIEIDDENNRVITRNMVSLIAGMGWGNIPLAEKKFPEGNYILRAYTNWMRNFDEHYVFTYPFTISSAGDESWLINSRFNATEGDGVTKIGANLTLVRTDNRPLIAEQLKTKITAGNSTLYRTSVITGFDGSTDFNFNLPDKTDQHRVAINLVKKTKGNADVIFNVPVILNRDEKTDLQFMPEGGSLIRGMHNRVAFKAINEEGKGINVSGVIYNSQRQQSATFASAHLGMGTFDFTPESGETYTAIVKLKGKVLSYNLPAIKSSGLLFGVDSETVSDSLVVNVKTTDDLRQQGAGYYLLAQARGMICYGAVVNIRKAAAHFSIAKSLFPTGITRLTLLNTDCQPVAERLIFIDQDDAIHIKVTSSKPVYGKRDSVNLAITANDKYDRPVRGSFALAVTDNAQVRPDSTNTDNLLSNLLLTDDLKGYVESPGWYFATGDIKDKAAALDNLMLTQGWVSYNWTEVFQPLKTPVWQPEQHFAVKGRVTNAFNKPVNQSQVVLLSTKPAMFVNTVTNANGEFIFTNLYPADTMVYMLQARNKKGRSFNVGVDVEEFKPTSFYMSTQRFIPWYINIDTSRLMAIHTRQSYNLEQDKLLGIKQLKEVQIKAQKVIKDSKKLLGPGEADFALNEHDLQGMGKITLDEILKKNVKGLIDNFRGGFYGINSTYTIFIFDGVSSLKFIPMGMRYTEYIRGLLNFIDAQDVKGIEVMTSGGGQMRYFNEYVNPRDDPFKYNFIEITTYSGSGLFLHKTPGTYLYRPLVFASQKQFYSPRYAVKTPDKFVDKRSTLFWAPNVITDTSGHAAVSFYTGDKSGTYNISIQGADMNGSVGVGQSKIIVKAGN